MAIREEIPGVYVDVRRQAPTQVYLDLMAGPDPRMEELLGPNGPIAKSLPGYRPRPAQVKMAGLVARAIRVMTHGIIEAGTGTGKTVSYAVAAIASGKKTVIATATLALQAQLMDDLAFLRRHLGIPFKFAKQMGRGNYACAAKTHQLPLYAGTERQEVDRWLQETPTGDIAELSFNLRASEHRELREQVTAGQEDCPGKYCPHASECFYYGARAAAEAADIVVTSHATVAQQLALGPEAQLLPEFDVLILDEAHQFEGYMRGALETRLTLGGLFNLLKKIRKLRVPVKDELQEVGDVARAVFEQVDEFRGQGENIPLQAGELPLKLLAAIECLERSLSDLLASIDERKHLLTDGRRRMLWPLYDSLGGFGGGLSSVKERNKYRVLWAEVPKDPERPVAIVSSPLKIGGYLRNRLFGARPIKTTILTSATLAVKRGVGAFDFIKRELGVGSALESQLDSPFDYARNTLYYFPAVTEDPSKQKGESLQQSTERYCRDCLPHFNEVLRATQGRALVLCTGFAAVDWFRERLDVPHPIKAQREMGKRHLVDWFKKTENSILVATKSFWEGVDLPGDDLIAVLIDKIPFLNNQHPLYQARIEAEGGGRQASLKLFYQLSLPHAIYHLKQAVGRLNRRETDRGIIVLPDPRLRTRKYAPRVLEALQGSPILDKFRREHLPHLGRFLTGARS